jgi:hypothetical protein
MPIQQNFKQFSTNLMPFGRTKIATVHTRNIARTLNWENAAFLFV